MATDKTLQEMLKERKAMDDLIAAKRKAERKDIVEQVKQLCKDYEISQSELRGALKTREKKNKDEGAEKTPTKSRSSKAEN
jgi:flagellin-specific chaperone FliS